MFESIDVWQNGQENVLSAMVAKDGPERCLVQLLKPTFLFPLRF